MFVTYAQVKKLHVVKKITDPWMSVLCTLDVLAPKTSIITPKQTTIVRALGLLVSRYKGHNIMQLILNWAGEISKEDRFAGQWTGFAKQNV